MASKTGKWGGGMLSLAQLLAKHQDLEAKILHMESGRGRKRGQKVGAYQGAVKLGSENMRARAKTGKSQAEFAALCGISERTLRTWESTGDVSTATGLVILAKLRALGAPVAPARRAVAYRDSYTGATWAGRGVMPAWLKAEMAKGRRLSEFATGA